MDIENQRIAEVEAMQSALRESIEVLKEQMAQLDRLIARSRQDAEPEA